MVFLSYISDPGKLIPVPAGRLSGFFFKTMAEMALGAVPVQEKYALTIREASEYFSIYSAWRTFSLRM